MPQNTAFDEHTIAYTDDAYDRERASDGHSRYGAYLADRAEQFSDLGDPLTPVEFAIAAWRVATSPVMSPGYVRVRHDLTGLTTGRDDEGNLHLRLELPLPHRALAIRPSSRPADWDARSDRWNPCPWSLLVEPEAITRPTLLTTAALLLPVPVADLVAPTSGYDRQRTTKEAKSAVQALVRHVNAHAHLIGALR
ncbi:hypothetical protein [Kitasatospora sp. P5_F3]